MKHAHVNSVRATPKEMQKVLPKTQLYQPLILNKLTNDEVEASKAKIFMDVKCQYSPTAKLSSMINPYTLTTLERHEYKAKVPISEGRFEYPVHEIKLKVITNNVFPVKVITLNSADYEIENGNIYFTRTLEKIAFGSRAAYNRLVGPEAIAHYELEVSFSVRQRDSGSAKNLNTALSQATHYALMEYMRQYYFAQTVGNMLAEVRYTKEITWWSSIISAPALLLGSGEAKPVEEVGKEAAKQSVKSIIGKVIAKSISQAFEEIFEEIIIDSFVESLVEWHGKESGWTQDAIFWVSNFATSACEPGAFGSFEFASKSIGLKIDNKIDSYIEKKIMQDITQEGYGYADNEYSIISNDQIKEYGLEQKARQKANIQSKLKTAGMILQGIGFLTMGIVSPNLFLSSLSLKTAEKISDKVEQKLVAKKNQKLRDKLVLHLQTEYGVDDIDPKVIEEIMGKLSSKIIQTSVMGSTTIDKNERYLMAVDELFAKDEFHREILHQGNERN